jgi:hypothetical protein
VTINNRRPFRQSEAESLLEEMQENRQFVSEKGLFANAEERQQVMEVYDEGIRNLQKILNDN